MTHRCIWQTALFIDCLLSVENRSNKVINVCDLPSQAWMNAAGAETDIGLNFKLANSSKSIRHEAAYAANSAIGLFWYQISHCKSDLVASASHSLAGSLMISASRLTACRQHVQLVACGVALHDRTLKLEGQPARGSQISNLPLRETLHLFVAASALPTAHTPAPAGQRCCTHAMMGLTS